jgi:phosphonoacetaldehyde hydrolase
LQLVILDFAGTTLDFGSYAPTTAFVEIFSQRGIQVQRDQVRPFMGRQKRDTIRLVAGLAPVREQWERVYNRPITAEDIDALYAAFIPALLKILPQHCTLLPGILEAADALRARGLKLANTTGYFEEAMQVCLQNAAVQGYTPDLAVCATQVKAGRPAPWMIYQVMQALDVYPPESVVKIGDTVVDIQAGLNAGAWSLGVVTGSSLAGLTQPEFDALDRSSRQAHLDTARSILSESGAHYVLETASDLLPVLDEIEGRLALGEKPYNLS